MADAKATLALGAVLKSGTKATFTAISGGLKAISVELQKTARDLVKMGKVDASNAVGHVGMAVGKVAEDFGVLSKQTKKTKEDLEKAVTPMKDMGKQLQVVQDAWKHYEKRGGKSLEATKANSKFVKSFANQLGDLSHRFHTAGLNQDAWLKSLKWSSVQQAMNNKQLDLSSGKIKINGEEGLKALGITGKYATAYRKFSTEQSVYNRQLDIAAKITPAYTKAVRALGKATGYNNEVAKVWAPTLKKVHSAMNTYQADMSKGTTISKKWIKSSNLAAITQQVLAKNIEVTSKGFRVMNEGGLSAFSNLSYEAAKNMGMLSKGFAQLSVKEGANSLTAYGKAQNDALQRSKKFRKEMDNLVKDGVGVSKAFETRYTAMKKTDDLWRKHTDTLQQAGKITVDTMHKMNAGFNANRIATKKGLAGYEALASTLKRVKDTKTSLVKTMKDVSKETKISRVDLAAEATAMRKNGASLKDIASAMQEKVKVQNEVVKNTGKLTQVEQQRAKLTGKSVERIKAESYARLDAAKGTKQYAQALRESLAIQKEKLNKDPITVAKKKELGDALRKINNEYGSLAKTHPQYLQGIQRITSEYKRNSTTLDKNVKALKTWSKSAVAARDKASLFSRALGSIREHIKSFASYAVAATMIASLTTLFAGAAMAVMDYDQALKDLQAITGATNYEVGQMGLKIKEVASSTKFSTKEVADGMKILGQAGLSAEEAVNSIDAVANLATGTLSDMATAVDLVTTAMRVFDIESEDSGRISDTFANAINKSKLTVDKLRTALNYVGPVAADAEISLEETAASMMTLANAGLKASTIGTGLRRVIAELVSPSKKLKDAAMRAGVPIEALNPTMTNFKEVLTNLQVVLSDTSEAFKIFGKYGAGSVLALVADLEGGYSKMLDSTSQFGTAAAMARKQMEGLGVAFKNMKDKFGLVAIALGDAGLTGVLKYLVDIGKDLADSLVFLVENGVKPLLNALDPVLWLIGKLAVPVLSLVTAFYSLKMALLAAAWASKVLQMALTLTAFKGLATRLLTTTTAVVGLRTAITGLFTIASRINPLVALAGVLGTVTMGLMSMKETTEEQVESFEKLQSHLKKNRNTLDGFVGELKRLKEADAGEGEILAFMIKLGEAFPHLGTKIYETKKDITELFKVLYAELDKNEQDDVMNQITDGFESSFAEAKEVKAEIEDLKVKWHPFEDQNKIDAKITMLENTLKGHIQRMATYLKLARKVQKDNLIDWSESFVGIGENKIKLTSDSDPLRKQIEEQADLIEANDADLSSLVPFGISKTLEDELDNVTTVYDRFLTNTLLESEKLPEILNSVNASTIKMHRVALEAFKDMADLANNTLYGDELNRERIRIHKEFQQYMAKSMDKDLKDASVYLLIKGTNEAKAHDAAVERIKAKNLTEKQLDAELYAEYQRHWKKMNRIRNKEFDSKEALKKYKVSVEERKAYNAQYLAGVKAQEETGLMSHEDAERAKAEATARMHDDILTGWNQLYVQIKDDNYLDPDTTKKVEKGQLKAYRDNEVAKTNVTVTNSKMRMYTIKKEIEDIEQLYEAQANATNLRVAKDTLSPDFADTANRSAEIDAISEKIELMQEEHDMYAALSFQNEKAKDLRRKINDLIAQRNTLSIEEAQKVTDTTQAMKDLNHEFAIQMATSKITMAEMVNDGGNTGYDSEIKRLEHIIALEEEASRLRLEKASQDYARDAGKEGATEEEKARALVALNEVVQAEQVANFERTKKLVTAELSYKTDMWNQSKLSMEDYHAAVQKAQDEGVITYRQATDRMMDSTDDMHAAFIHGWKRYGETIKTQAQLMQDVAATIYEALTDGLADPLYDIISGSKSAGEAFKDFANSVLEDITKMILKMTLLELFGNKKSTGGTGSWLGGILGYAKGGSVQGNSPSPTADNIPIMATADEYVEPVDVVKHYGVDVFEAFRRKLIPKNFMQMLTNVTKIPSTMNVSKASGVGYASGGSVTGPSQTVNRVSVPVNVSGAGFDVEQLVALLQGGIESTVINILRRQS